MITQKTFNKNTALSIVLFVIVVLILIRITPSYVEPVIKLVISKNKTLIHNIHQPRNIESHREVMVDKLDLEEDNRFRHAELGNIGYADQFFVDINETFTVNRPGWYLFIIGSDDGFTAQINDKPLCEYVSDRPFTKNTCRANLSAGEHRFKLSYFQGYGNAGLTVQYKKMDSEDLYYFGEDSAYISFD